MKSAYELAMERLEKNAPSVALTSEQKTQLAEIDSSYKAKIAEKELFLKDQIRKAQTERQLRRSGIAAKTTECGSAAPAGRLRREEGKTACAICEIVW